MVKFLWENTIKTNLVFLRMAGLWPAGYHAYELNFYLLYAILATTFIIGGHNLTQIVNIYYVYNDLVALTATIFVAATNTFSVVKRYFFMKNLGTIKRLFVILNSEQFKPKNAYQKKLVQDSVTKWKNAYISFTVVASFNLTLWILVPVVNGWIKDHVLPFPAWYPFKVDKFPNYEIVYGYQFICIWYIALCNLNVDTLIYAFMMFIGCQCDLLVDDLQTLEGDESYGEKLKTCVKHHEKILRFAKDTNDIFNIIIFGQITTSTAALALSMFQLSLVEITSGAAMAHLAYMFGMCTEVFFYCWFGNEVQLKSGNIPFAVFQSEWYGQSKTAFGNLIILCEKSRNPIKITAMNLFTFSLETFLAILRSAWSYFAVLSTVNSK